ncbi:MAG TPA: hypothetical protein VFA55_05105, partial [Candidatus Kapabacteria bacterium]|nr:hypothetical protein [Candidatus Kapabacteria bacterium]
SVERAHEFKEVLAANLDTIQLNAPGSMSTSIKLEEDDRVQSITWGSTDHPNVPDALKEWYDDFMNACGAMQTQ